MVSNLSTINALRKARDRLFEQYQAYCLIVDALKQLEREDHEN